MESWGSGSLPGNQQRGRRGELWRVRASCQPDGCASAGRCAGSDVGIDAEAGLLASSMVLVVSLACLRLHSRPPRCRVGLSVTGDKARAACHSTGKLSVRVSAPAQRQADEALKGVQSRLHELA